jgi:hypothetical protein
VIFNFQSEIWDAIRDFVKVLVAMQGHMKTHYERQCVTTECVEHAKTGNERKYEKAM